MKIWEMARQAFDNAKAKGFHDQDMVNETDVVIMSGPRFSESLMLVVSEAGEAIEEYRQHGLAYESLIRIDEDGKPVGVAVELADIVIRVGDLAEAIGVDLEDAVARKMRYNDGRPFKHGGLHA